MSVRNMDAIFWPRKIAVVGASDTEGSVGRAVFRNLVDSRYDGDVYPINPKYEAVHGEQCFKSVRDTPDPPDLAVIATPASTLPRVINDCGERGVRGLVILTAGFGETGEEGRRMEADISQEIRKFRGMRAIGPNCLGIIVPGLHMNASFGADMPDAGHLAFISQSGALCTSILDMAIQNRIGFSHFISVGNMLDVDFGDLVDYLSAEPQTKALILYIESIKSARKFISAARAFSRNKPIIAYKAGRFSESAAAAASHTGAMAGADDVYDAAFRRAGIERVYALEDLFESAELLARTRPVRGRRLAIVTNAGGPGVVATDALIARGGTLATLEKDSIEELNSFLPPHWSHGNPVDVLGDAPPDRLARALEVVLQDDGVDAALVTLAPQAMTDPTETAQAVARVSRNTRKTILAAWMGGNRMEGGIRVLSTAGIPVYRNSEDCVNAFMHLVNYNQNQELLYETPREVPIEIKGSHEEVRQVLLKESEEAGEDGLVTLTEDVSKDILDAYGINVTKAMFASTADEAAAAANEIGYPVVVKVFSPDISHKTDVGGIALGIETEASLREAFERVTASAKSARPDADVKGVTVQRMVDIGKGIELILGLKTDRTFGAAIMVGAGGTTAEIFQDRAIQLPPLNERRALQMLEKLRIWPMLNGYRGRPKANIDELIETLLRFSYVVAENPGIREIDINPLLVTPTETIGLDARIIVDRQTLIDPPRAYRHMAIRPYPEEFTKNVTLGDGTAARLRPIKPEDEPMWHNLLNRCSPESLWFRLGSAIKSTTHKMATRYCYIDYDREIAIVVEIEAPNGERSLIGVGRLVAGPNHDNAEFAIIVDDAWQGKGVGSMLTDYCLDVARKWGMQTVNAVTLPQNDRMLRIFRRRRFESKFAPGSEWVALTLDLAKESAPAV